MAEEPTTPDKRAELLVQLFMHFDTMMWRTPLQYLGVAALVLGAGAWIVGGVEGFMPELAGAKPALFGGSLAFAGVLLLVGANHMSNSRRHKSLVREELRVMSGITYFSAAKSFLRISAPGLAIALMVVTALAMIAGGALLALGLKLGA